MFKIFLVLQWPFFPRFKTNFCLKLPTTWKDILLWTNKKHLLFLSTWYFYNSETVSEYSYFHAVYDRTQLETLAIWLKLWLKMIFHIKSETLSTLCPYALESRRVSLGAHWVDSRESSLLRRLERGREIGL